MGFLVFVPWVLRYRLVLLVVGLGVVDCFFDGLVSWLI